MERLCPKCLKRFPASNQTCPEDGCTLVPCSPGDLSGKTLDGRYVVREVLGQGGMGQVYVAEHQMLGRRVALKVLKRDLAQDESSIRRFLNEAKAISGLKSRNTVTLFDFGVTGDGLIYYTMELLDGHSLKELLRDHGPLGVAQAARIAIQVCNSLGEAHANGILHRDIKPDNIFIIQEPEGLSVRVLDFGVAKLLNDASSADLSCSGMVVGTPKYFSPEQAMGVPLTAASDLYSLGVVLFEMLCGVPPFSYDSAVKIVTAHIQEPVPPLSRMRPGVAVPARVEDFVRRVLAKEPLQRPASAAEFAAALAGLCQEASGEAPQAPPLALSGKPTLVGRLKRPEVAGLEQTEISQAGLDQWPQSKAAVPQAAPAPLDAGSGPGDREGRPPLASPRNLALGALVLTAFAALAVWFFWPAPFPGTGPKPLATAQAPLPASASQDQAAQAPQPAAPAPAAPLPAALAAPTPTPRPATAPRPPRPWPLPPGLLALGLNSLWGHLAQAGAGQPQAPAPSDPAIAPEVPVQAQLQPPAAPKPESPSPLAKKKAKPVKAPQAAAPKASGQAAPSASSGTATGPAASTPAPAAPAAAPKADDEFKSMVMDKKQTDKEFESLRMGSGKK